MANKYGRIIVCGDYEGDLKAIVDILNLLRWSFGYSDCEKHEWAVEQRSVGKFDQPGRSERIVLNGNVPCPSLRPMGHFAVLKNGRRYFANDADRSIIADVSFLEQWKAGGGSDWDQCTLGELSDLISPLLTKGTIEFVAAHASGGYVSHERLVVSAVGYAEWHNCNSSSHFALDRWTRRETEYYPLDC